MQQGPGLTLSEPVVEGQHYLVVNCDEHPLVRRIWVLWHAQRGDSDLREVGSPLRRFVFAQRPSSESHVEDVLPQARYRLKRVPMVPVSVAAALIARAPARPADDRRGSSRQSNGQSRPSRAASAAIGGRLLA